MAGGDPCGSDGWSEESTALTLSSVSPVADNGELADIDIIAFLAMIMLMAASVVSLPIIILRPQNPTAEEASQKAEKLRARLQRMEFEKGAILRELEPLERDQQVRAWQRLKAERA
jgi:hypothetical protein